MEYLAQVMSVHPIVRAEAARLQLLCRKHHVRRLDLFGSATREDFDATRSDLDFIVEFEPLTMKEHADAYFGLLFDLEDLFERKIDLVEREPLRNPYFIQEIEETRVPLYAA
jgi:predicted nucleotidyltransferase